MKATKLIDRYWARARRAGWSIDTFDHVRAELDRLARQVRKMDRTEGRFYDDKTCVRLSEVLALIKEARR
jgi:hypothetical protein